MVELALRQRWRTRHHPVRRRRRIAYGALGVVVVLAVAAVLITRDALAIRRTLLIASGDIAATRTALASGEVDAAREHLTAARQVIAAADVRTDRALWRVAEHVPLAGRSLAVADRVVEVAAAATGVGRQVIDAAGGLLGEDSDLRLDVADGRVSLEPLREAGDALSQVEIGWLRSARDQLAQAPATWLPEVVRDARRESLALADQALAGMGNGVALVDVLPAFLGADGPRRYFLAMQNSAELRGTGGLIGFWSVLTVDDGAFSLSEPQVYNVLDRDPDEPEENYTPVTTTEEFRDRYQHINAAGFFANVNADPDLPTTARVLLDLYAQRTDERLDGVIAVDPVGLEAILQAIGAVQLPTEVLDPGERLPAQVPPDRVAEITLVDAYEVLGGPSPQRKRFHKAFATSVFDRIFAGGWDAVAVARRLGEAAGGGHVQLFSEHADEQEVFATMGVGGSLHRTEPAGGDFLAVTANNAAGNKMDVHVGHEFTGDVRLVRDGDGWRRSASVGVGVVNPLSPDGHDTYIIMTCPTSTSMPRCDRDLLQYGINRTWFTVWASDSTVVREARDAAGQPLEVGLGRIHGHVAVDHFLETPSRSENRFEVDLAGPVELLQDGPDLVYRLALWRQAKAIPDRVDLTIAAPAGWDVAEASVDGGGDGAGMGVFNEPGPPVAASVDGDRVRVAGDVNTDLYLEVRFTRSLRDRFVDWLRRPAF